MSDRPQQAPLLAIRNLSVSYTTRDRTFDAVRLVSLDLGKGEVVALVGESGSGKTTIARAIMAMLAPQAKITGGSIRYEGQELIGLSPREYDRVRGREIGWIPQDPMVSLNPLHRIGKQVSEPLRIHGLADARDAEQRAVALLDRVGIQHSEARAHQYPHELSGGMRQRALIAGALAAEPQLIIADEPTTALDVTVQKRILDDLEQLRASAGISVLLITHDLAVAAERAHRVVVLRHGEIVEQGTAADVLKNPQHAYTKLLLASAPSMSQGRLRPLASPVKAEQANASPPILVALSVSKSFDVRGPRSVAHRVDAVKDATIELRAGETLGLVGESGSGKSTLSRLLLGLVPPSAGRVLFEGEEIGGFGRGRHRQFRQAIQPVYQNPYASLNPRFSVAEIIGEPLLGFGIGDREERGRRVLELLDQVKLPRTMGERRTSELSGGQRQRVAIARALAPNPKLIVCDEPVSALDVSVQSEILKLLAEFQETQGLGYLFISHDLAVVRQVADRVAVMKDGVIVESGTTAEVFDRPRHDYTKLLIDSIPGRQLEAA
ncbi:ABC transporter ATP-binding protein [Mesorhizobium sp. DCY119]|uniref:dipeptide ABC transporter ATP-binding protein n=1 Tax=Mesorhizobium sp. DCY119 TaxID=2108445 RepID=UPI000E71E989|nr:ABC transporter ATP-binding protein [Mesorhizobium sp. DCY119]RJG40452.1 ABC transporter ATP-binding protein [Mesorhizobium sp. DCY119]